MKILVFGSSSNIGNQVISYLIKVKKIDKIYCVDINVKRKCINKLEFINYKDNLLEKLKKGKKIDIVIDFSFITNFKNKNKSIYIKKSKDLIIKKLLKLCKNLKNQKIIYISSIAVYGDNENLLTERSKTKPHSLHAKAKLNSENIIKKKSKKL